MLISDEEYMLLSANGGFHLERNKTLISDYEKCPCGSGKLYGICCEIKDFEWLKDDKGTIYKNVKLSDETMNGLKVVKEQFKETFGRDPKGEDKLFYSVAIKQFNFLNDFIRICREAGVEERYLYAYYCTGLLVTEENKERISDREYDEWEEAVFEFENLTNEGSIDNRINIVQAILLVEEGLTIFLEKAFEQLELGLSKFILDSKNAQVLEVDSFQVCDHKSFIEYCLYKIIKNMDSVSLLISNGHKENALAVVRFLYDIYLNIFVYISDYKLFEEKILPLIGLELGTHVRVNGSKHKIEELATEKKTYTKVSIIELAKQAGKQNPTAMKMYDSLFSELSGYVHVSVLMSDKYFSENDPYYELNEELLAGLLAVFFAYLPLYEIIKLDHVTLELKRDILFLANRLTEQIRRFLVTLKGIEENPVFDLMEEMLNYYEKTAS